MAASPISESESNRKLAEGEANSHDHLEEEEDSLSFAMGMMDSMAAPLALRSAIEMGVFDIIAQAGEGAKLSAKEIAAQIGTSNPQAPSMLDRLLGLLATHSLLRCSLAPQSSHLHARRLYSLSPGSKYFVTDADDGVSLGPLLALLLDNVFYQSWSELKGAILEGGVPFNRVHGMHVFEYPSVDPRFNEVFNKAMLNCTAIIMKRILECYKGFERINRLVDIGGSTGVNLKLITSKYPHVQGINFDLPHVVQHAPLYTGVEHVGGDMFESVPTGDAVFMKWILHDWSDEHCLKLLKNCYKAIPDDGKVIVVEQILPVVPETTATAKAGFGTDLLMMTQNPGGKERTRQEFMDLATGSGFSGIKFVCSVSDLWVMEFFK